MKIAVIGAGAIGSIIGGLLAESGEDVTLIGRKAHVDAINKHGLLLIGDQGEIQIHVKAAESLDFKPDLVLLAMKTQDVEAAARQIKEFVSGVPIVTMQNGVQSDNLVAGILGKENIISTVVAFSGTFLKSGQASFSNPFSRISLLIGEPFGSGSKRLEDVAVLLNKALPAGITEDIRGAHWTKLLYNLNTAIPAITGLPLQEAISHPQIRKLSILLMREGLHLANSAGIKLTPIPGGTPISRLKVTVNLPLPIASFVQMLGWRALRRTPVPMLGSILQSIKREKTTEIDYLNGEIVRLGKDLGKPTPYNSRIVDLVHQVEATGKFLTIDELTQKLR